MCGVEDVGMCLGTRAGVPFGRPRLLEVRLGATRYTRHPAPYTLQPTAYSLQPTAYSLHPAIHPTPYTLRRGSDSRTAVLSAPLRAAPSAEFGVSGVRV